MANFLSETIKVLQGNGKHPSDVVWVGNTEEYAITWEEFKQIADFDYDNGFGGQEIAEDLLVVGKDFWLERHEFDGSEWWEYKSQPKKPKNPKKIKAVYTKDDYWCTLKQMEKNIRRIFDKKNCRYICKECLKEWCFECQCENSEEEILRKDAKDQDPDEK